MIQDSPFAISDDVKRGGGKRDPSLVISRRGVYAQKDGCSAKMVTIIQTSEKKSKNPLNLLKVGNRSIFVTTGLRSVVAETSQLGYSFEKLGEMRTTKWINGKFVFETADLVPEEELLVDRTLACYSRNYKTICTVYIKCPYDP